MIYKSDFASVQNGTNYRVEITTSTGTGEKNFTLGASPFVTSMDSDGKTIYAPIKTTGATVEMLTETLPFDIYSTNNQGTKVKLTNLDTNTVEWVGYATPCAYTQGFDDEREIIEIEAVDGIASLKDVPFRTATKEVNTFLNIIFKILKRANCYRYLYVTDNVQMTASTSDNILSKIRVSEGNFFDNKDYEAQPDDDVAWDCYDVLYEIMQYMGYTLIAYGEDAYILDYDAIRGGRKKYYRYSLTGTSIGSATNVEITHSFIINGASYSENGTSISLAEVYNQAIIKDEFTEIESLIDGLNSQKNLENITAPTDPTLKNWVNTDSRFLESEVFTVKNKLGEDESFVVALVKSDDHNHKIFFVIAKFYKNALVQTYHYNNSNVTLPESQFNPMQFSKLWNVKGANCVGYFTQEVESSKYNVWRAGITSNWDGQTKEAKLEQFGKLCNITNIGNKKLVDYIVCLNQDTNHIEHDNVKNYPFFKVSKDIPTVFGGDGGYIVLKGTIIRHYEFNAPFPMNGTVYVHKDERQTSIYKNEGYVWSRLKWGNYYWKCEGDYTDTGEWVTTPSYFKIFYGDPTTETRVETWQDKDVKFYNNCGALWGVDEDGYYIPTPPSGNLVGTVEWTMYANKDTKGKWARNNKKDKKNSYNGFKPKCMLYKNLDIKLGYSDDAMNDEAASADTVYTNDVSDYPTVIPMKDIKFKICTYDNKTPSLSTVDYLVGSKSEYLDTTYNQATKQTLRQEHHLVMKLVSQYQSPRVNFEANLKKGNDIKPWTLLTDKTLSGRYFIVDKLETDYKEDSTKITIIEKTNNYD